MTAPRQTYSLEEIKDRLLQRVEDVARKYAPAVQGSHVDKGRYWTLNPGRADTKVGSFYVQLSGPKSGMWYDFAVQSGGDILDLIALSLNCSLADALKEARAYLGLATEAPEQRAQRDQLAKEAAAKRRAAEAQDRDREARRQKQAYAIYMSGQAIAGTPVESYLRVTRGIDLRQLGRAPGALRFVPKCWCNDIDPETGEVIEGDLPAMVAAMTDLRGRLVAIHRTYLALDGSGRWAKASISKPKKMLGVTKGAFIPIWRGVGPRGGKPKPLAHAAPGSRVLIAEGIEDALSAALLCPDFRVLAAGSLGAMGRVELPEAISDVTIIADQDDAAEVRAVLDRAIAAHQSAGRRVAVFRNGWGGKDLNDALRAAQSDGKGAA